jgi:hypothetical protein
MYKEKHMGRKIENGRFTKCYDKKLTKKFLEKEYPKKGAYVLSKSLNIHVKTIYNYLEYYNIPRTRKISKTLKSGQIFGLLTLLHPEGKNKSDGGTKWKCQCSCGNTTIVPQSRLKTNRVKSCGCWKKRKMNHRWKGYCGISGARVSEIKGRARKHNFDFDLDPKFLWNLYIDQNKKCAITGKPIEIDIDGSLDRIDSSKGYVRDNVWWVTKNINKMKLDFSLPIFIDLCEQVVANKEKIKYGREA